MSSDNNAEMGLPIEVGQQVPNVDFPVRVPNEDGETVWGTLNSETEFAGKRVIIFGLPGAFTPTCSSQQVPGYEGNFKKFQALQIDDIYCISVNDSFVMNAWSQHMGIEKVKMIPDGSGNFTRFMGMLIGKNHLGFGNRSWRYMAVIDNGVVEKFWQEPGINNEGKDDDPYVETTPENVMEYLRKSE